MNLNKIEIWKPVVGFETVYEVSNLGRLRRLTKVDRAPAGYILNPSINKKGYLQTVLRNGKANTKTIRLHKIVAQAFLGECLKDFEVNHINGNKLDNSAENLEYITHLENMRHAEKNNLIKAKRGVKKKIIQSKDNL